MPISAAVVEDDTFTRLTLTAAIQSHGVDVAISVGDPAEALELARTIHCHVAVLDLHLGAGPTGIDLAIALRRLQPRIGLVLLTSFDDPRLLSPSLPSIPRGTQYVTKQSVSSMSLLLQAVRDAVEIAGGARAEHPSGPPSSSQVAGLTDTQVETLRLLAQGLSNAEIARRRSVTESSVEATITRISRTLGLDADTTRNQRVHMAKVYFRSLGVAYEDG